MRRSIEEWLEADPNSAGVVRSILEMLLSHEAKISSKEKPNNRSDHNDEWIHQRTKTKDWFWNKRRQKQNKPCTKTHKQDQHAKTNKFTTQQSKQRMRKELIRKEQPQRTDYVCVFFFRNRQVKPRKNQVRMMDGWMNEWMYICYGHLGSVEEQSAHALVCGCGYMYKWMTECVMVVTIGKTAIWQHVLGKF